MADYSSPIVLDELDIDIDIVGFGQTPEPTSCLFFGDLLDAPIELNHTLSDDDIELPRVWCAAGPPPLYEDDADSDDEDAPQALFIAIPPTTPMRSLSLLPAQSPVERCYTPPTPHGVWGSTTDLSIYATQSPVKRGFSTPRASYAPPHYAPPSSPSIVAAF